MEKHRKSCSMWVAFTTHCTLQTAALSRKIQRRFAWFGQATKKGAAHPTHVRPEAQVRPVLVEKHHRCCHMVGFYFQSSQHQLLYCSTALIDCADALKIDVCNSPGYSSSGSFSGCEVELHPSGRCERLLPVTG